MAEMLNGGDGEPVEKDPTGRYLRFPQLLGRGACKSVYRGIDCEMGRLVAWNQVQLAYLGRDDFGGGRGFTDGIDPVEQLLHEISVLQKLHHKNIMTMYDWWYDPEHTTINFITEVFTSGTLRAFRKRTLIMNETILKRWAWQILEGLVYLHGHVPPIVHRDLKCDNIFINSHNGQIKIGDLGLATAQASLSVVGTPEFMAPEIYDEQYNEKVDIYSFGMCLLELATLEYPYSECHGVAQIYRRVTTGNKPQALQSVASLSLRELIEQCLAFDPRDRPSARQLLKHAYFEQLRELDSADRRSPSPAIKPGGSPVTAASGSSGGSAPPANARSLTSPVQVPHAEQGPFAAAAHAPAGPNSDNARPLLSPADMARMRAGSTICTTPPPDLGRFGMGHVGNDSSDEEEVLIPMDCLANMAAEEEREDYVGELPRSSNAELSSSLLAGSLHSSVRLSSGSLNRHATMSESKDCMASFARASAPDAASVPPASPSIGTPDGRMAATSRAASLASHSSFATPSAAGARLPPPGPGALARCGSFVPVLRNATSLAVAPGMGLRGGGSCSGRQPSAGSSRPSGSGTPLLLSPALSGAHDASPHRMCGVSPSRSWHPSAHCAPTAASRGLPPMLPPLATPPPPPPVHVALPDPAMSSGAATPEHLSQDLLLQSSMRSRSRAHDGMRGPAGSEHARPVHGVLVRVKQLRDRAFGPSPLQRHKRSTSV